MNLETVRLEVADYIATVTIDRPPVNAQNQKAREELIRVFDAISDRDDVRVAILTARRQGVLRRRRREGTRRASPRSRATTSATIAWCANISTRSRTAPSR